MRSLTPFIILTLVFGLVFSAVGPVLAESDPEAEIFSTVEATPRLLGGFIVNNEAMLAFSLKNTGAASDSYTFSISHQDGASDWNVQVLTTTYNPVTSTGSIAPGASQSFYLRFIAPPTAASGDFSRVLLQAVSTSQPAHKVDINAQSAIAAPFVQSFIDSTQGYIQYNVPNRSLTRRVFDVFSGSLLVMQNTSGTSYQYAWEYKQTSETSVTGNIKLVTTTPFSATQGIIKDLQDNSATGNTWDDNPSFATNSSGQTGLLYIRHTYQRDGLNYLFKANVYFARISDQGDLIGTPVRLTNNETYASYSQYNQTSATAANNGRFFLAWQKTTGDGTTTVIETAVIEPNGTIVKAAAGASGSDRSYIHPAVTRLANGNVMLGYLAEEDDGNTRQVMYHILQPDGTLGSQVALDSAFGDELDIQQLTGGGVLFAWSNSEGRIFRAMTDQTGTVTQPVAEITHPWGRSFKHLSITHDAYNRGIITFRDYTSEFLYYTLIGGDGSLVTAPMPFRRGSVGSNPIIFTSHTGYGNAPLNEDHMPAFIYLPLVKR